MTQNIPSEWVAIADNVQGVIDSVATSGFWTISVANPLYDDLYIQGTWDDDEVEKIWLELGSEDGAIKAKLLPLGWSEPDDEIPNYWVEKPWKTELEQRTAVAFLIEALIALGLEADNCELSAYTEEER